MTSDGSVAFASLEEVEAGVFGFQLVLVGLLIGCLEFVLCGVVLQVLQREYARWARSLGSRVRPSYHEVKLVSSISILATVFLRWHH